MSLRWRLIAIPIAVILLTAPSCNPRAFRLISAEALTDAKPYLEETGLEVLKNSPDLLEAAIEYCSGQAAIARYSSLAAGYADAPSSLTVCQYLVSE